MLRLGGRATGVLEDLSASNLLDTRAAPTGPIYRYAPAHPALEQAVELLAQAHSDNIPELLRTLTKNAIERVRAAAGLAFAAGASTKKSKG